MFICTYKEEKREMLLKKGFKLICKQHQGDKCLYTFELKPTLYSLFTEEDEKEIFLSNKICMA